MTIRAALLALLLATACSSVALPPAAPPTPRICPGRSPVPQGAHRSLLVARLTIGQITIGLRDSAGKAQKHCAAKHGHGTARYLDCFRVFHVAMRTWVGFLEPRLASMIARLFIEIENGKFGSLHRLRVFICAMKAAPAVLRRFLGIRYDDIMRPLMAIPGRCPKLKPERLRPLTRILWFSTILDISLSLQ